MADSKSIVLFEEKRVRRVWDEKTGKWYFSVVDVVAVLTDADYQKSRKYWKVLKGRLAAEGNESVTNCYQLKMTAEDGKMRLTDAADTEGLLRIIQSVPSPKAEPFKRWLAKVGYERMQEIENPELATKRMHDTYLAKGYSEEWIALRMRGIAIRETLTDEWKKRGVDEATDYAILTSEISKAAFGMTPSEYKQFKGLGRGGDNLRDHMTDLELIFSQLGEAATTEIARNDDAQGFFENKDAAIRGGKIAGDARNNLEAQTGRRVSTKDNYKHLAESKKRKSLKR
ncbi:MAG: Bro-N domain-containing protein [Syntrophobacterales bacterium]|nr:Bro-N domain-containing protein [Syntrophobacterales bacterium]